MQGSGLVAAGGNAIPDNSLVDIVSGTTLTLLADETLGGLTGAGTVSQGSNVLRVGANNFDTTFTGNLNGVGPFEKLGSGTLTLTGPSNVGGTSILGGALVLWVVAVLLLSPLGFVRESRQNGRPAPAA